MKVSVVLPVYNCAGNLKPLFEEFISEKPDQIKLELVWVNDASTDESLAEISELRSEVIEQEIINLTKNIGSYRAIVEALSTCAGDAVVIMAADGQDPPKVALDLATQLSDFDLAAAARDSASGGFANRLFHSIMRRKVGPNASPDPFDMVAFRTDRIPEILEDQRSRSHLFYFLDQLIDNKKVLKFSKRPRVHGNSGWSLRKKILLFWQCMLLF